MKTVAVVGLSDKSWRVSYGVAGYLVEQGVRIIPVNPQAAGKKILGQKVYASLTDIPKDTKIDVVCIFRRSELVAPVVDEVIARGEGAVWMQIGVIDETSAAKARAAGRVVVMDRCIAVEHRLRLAA